ncbi:hypothetical protein Vretimale_1718 [Volvox reticuliferus]|uniref:Guanylate cyclase domain-containing protein n=2 Tax=Volvox reticuliferus TaxID=1737510 RepID=A0A8J4D509_9CHLO|nr:hypothetical protein Vretimale_1718 [Volvox reticuliferus]
MAAVHESSSRRLSYMRPFQASIASDGRTVGGQGIIRRMRFLPTHGSSGNTTWERPSSYPKRFFSASSSTATDFQAKSDIDETPIIDENSTSAVLATVMQVEAAAAAPPKPAPSPCVGLSVSLGFTTSERRVQSRRRSALDVRATTAASTPATVDDDVPRSAVSLNMLGDRIKSMRSLAKLHKGVAAISKGKLPVALVQSTATAADGCPPPPSPSPPPWHPGGSVSLPTSGGQPAIENSKSPASPLYRSHSKKVARSRTSSHALVVIDMGIHRLQLPALGPAYGDVYDGVQVIQLLPAHLKHRAAYQPPLKSQEQLAPGFFDAPGAAQALMPYPPSQPPSFPRLSLMFIQPAGYSTVANANLEVAERSGAVFCGAVREVLQMYGAYECQEYECTFMVACSGPRVAAEAGLALQEWLLQADWPTDLFELSSGRLALGPGGRPLLRGFRAKVGIFTGVPLSVVPHATTGRADYFGAMVNRAARLMAGAKAGQVLMDKVAGLEVLREWRQVAADAAAAAAAMSAHLSPPSGAVATNVAAAALHPQQQPRSQSRLFGDEVSVSSVARGDGPSEGIPPEAALLSFTAGLLPLSLGAAEDMPPPPPTGEVPQYITAAIPRASSPPLPLPPTPPTPSDIGPVAAATAVAISTDPAATTPFATAATPTAATAVASTNAATATITIAATPSDATAATSTAGVAPAAGSSRLIPLVHTLDSGAQPPAIPGFTVSPATTRVPAGGTGTDTGTGTGTGSGPVSAGSRVESGPGTGTGNSAPPPPSAPGAAAAAVAGSGVLIYEHYLAALAAGALASSARAVVSPAQVQVVDLGMYKFKGLPDGQAVLAVQLKSAWASAAIATGGVGDGVAGDGDPPRVQSRGTGGGAEMGGGGGQVCGLNTKAALLESGKGLLEEVLVALPIPLPLSGGALAPP